MSIETLVETGYLPGPEEIEVLRELRQADCPPWLAVASTPDEVADALDLLIAREGRTAREVGVRHDPEVGRHRLIEELA